MFRKTDPRLREKSAWIIKENIKSCKGKKTHAILKLEKLHFAPNKKINKSE